jgi:hypothetical protein
MKRQKNDKRKSKRKKKKIDKAFEDCRKREEGQDAQWRELRKWGEK